MDFAKPAGSSAFVLADEITPGFWRALKDDLVLVTQLFDPTLKRFDRNLQYFGKFRQPYTGRLLDALKEAIYSLSYSLSYSATRPEGHQNPAAGFLDSGGKGGGNL